MKAHTIDGSSKMAFSGALGYPLGLIFFIDEAAGDDANDGLSWATAFKSFGHIWQNVMPSDVTEQYWIAFRGTLSIDNLDNLYGLFNGKIFHGRAGIRLFGADGSNPGGTYLPELAGSPFSTTGTDIGNGWYGAVVAAAGWTPNEHIGKIVYDITDGSSDSWGVVVRNTADTLYFAYDWGIASAHSLDFATYPSILDGDVWFDNVSAGPDSYTNANIQLGDFYFDGELNPAGSQSVLIGNFEGRYDYTRLDNTDIGPATFGPSVIFADKSFREDKTNPGGERIGANFTGGIYLERARVWLGSFVAQYLELSDCEISGNSNAPSRISYVMYDDPYGDPLAEFLGCYGKLDGIHFWCPNVGGNEGPAVRMVSSYLVVRGQLWFTNCSDCFELYQQSRLYLIHSAGQFAPGVATGCTGYGVRVHGGARCMVDDASPALNTGYIGTAGEAICGLAAATALWSAIQAGTQLVDATCLSRIYEENADISAMGGYDGMRR